MSDLDPTTVDFARRLGASTGIAFSGQLNRALDRAVRRTLAQNPQTDRRSLFRQLEDSADATVDLIEALAIGETYFFRHSRQFDVIRAQLLPRLAVRERRPLVMWSAGCSTGEEPYSLAMLLDDAGLANEAIIVASDINHHSLTRARRGVYTRNSFRSDGHGRARRHVAETGGSWRIDKEVRERVRFLHLNLAQDRFKSIGLDPASVDLIMCRNVMMYFDEPTVSRIVGGFVEVLVPGGFIVTGPTDPPLWDRPELDVVTLDAGAVYRKRVPHDVTPGSRPRPRRRGVRHRRGRGTSHASTTASEAPKEGEDLAEAHAALEAGDWEGAAHLTAAMSTEEAAILHIRAEHNVDPDGALVAAIAASERYPLSGAVHYLGATLLVCHGDTSEAIRWLRRATYADKTLVLAHYLTAVLRCQQDQWDEARRAFARVRSLCKAMADGEVVPFGDGITAAQLAEAAHCGVTRVDGKQGCKT